MKTILIYLETHTTTAAALVMAVIAVIYLILR